MNEFLQQKNIFFLSVAFFLLGFIIPYSIGAAETQELISSSGTESKGAEDTDGRIQESVLLIEAGSHREAETILLELERQVPSASPKISMLLGRLYLEESTLEKAEVYLKKAAENYLLLRDYALKLLMDMYSAREEYEAVLSAAGQIENVLLMQDVTQQTIEALLALGQKDNAIKELVEYITLFPDDWEYVMKLASLYRERDDSQKAINLFRKIYISAVPVFEGEAFRGLESLGAGTLTGAQRLQRAENLFRTPDYARAEQLYREVLDLPDRTDSNNIQFRIAMCQFNTKRYSKAAESFGRLDTPKAMYWQARSYYRISDITNFNRVRKAFQEKYPFNDRLGLLHLMAADDLRRKGNRQQALVNYKKASTFQKHAEDALWGISWMYFTADDYNSAEEYFSRLTAYSGSREYYKYLYWKARNKSKIAEQCMTENSKDGAAITIDCTEGKGNYFDNLDPDAGYYGYLIRLNSSSSDTTEKIASLPQPRPEGTRYERMEALALLGMREAASNEFRHALKKARKQSEYLYLGWMANTLEEYKEVIAFAEPRNEDIFLPLSYPRGHWQTISQAAATDGVDTFLVAALIREESRYEHDVVSWAGAVGLMQLMPATAKRIKRGITTLDGNDLDLTNVKTNIFIGTHYLAKLLNRFNLYPFAIAAYNAGENALVRWINELDSTDIPRFIEDIPYTETRNYVKKVLKSYWQYRRVYGFPVTGDDIICAGTCLQATPKPVIDASLSDVNRAAIIEAERGSPSVQ